MKKLYSAEHIGPCAVALGTFDGVHIGHRAVIGAAAATGLPAVVVTSDLSAREFFGRGGSRIADSDDCDEQFRTLGVHAVVSLPFADIRDMSPEQYLDMLRVRLGAVHICCGYNYHFGKGAAGDVDTIRRYCDRYSLGCTVCDCVSSERGDVSSTAIRAMLLDGDVEGAAVMLGRPYSISGEVVGGDQRGRVIGVPTVNQHLGAASSAIRFGVYRSRVVIDGKTYDAMTNVGIRPTYRTDLPMAETHVIGYDGDLYSRKLRVQLLEFIREERKFASLEELERTLKEDIARCRNTL